MYGDKVRHHLAKKGGKSVKEETLHEISADKLLDASKAADKDSGKLAVAGDKEGAKKRVRQAVNYMLHLLRSERQKQKKAHLTTYREW